MLVILITILLIIFLINLADFSSICIPLIVVTFFGGLIVSLYVPIAGYEEPVLEKEIQLEPFEHVVSENPDEDIYLMISRGENDDNFTYRKMSKDEYGLETTVSTETISATSENVKIHQDASCKKPVLKIYEQKAKGKWWLTLAIDTTKTIYKFYLPENSVIR